MPVRFRPATTADAPELARGIIAGLAEYPAFAPAGWTPPPLDAETAHLRALLGADGTWCLIAELDGALTGQITMLPAERAPHPVADPALAHISNLFVRRDAWGSGLAAELLRRAVAAARERDVAELRLFVAVGQERARRFYEREGWRVAGEPFDDPVPGLAMLEYRRTIRPRAG